MLEAYGRSFYDSQREASLRSARQVVPHLIDLVSPQSVVDVGCGVGTWTSLFQESGVCDLLGIDGGNVEAGRLLIPGENFMPMDLEHPTGLSRKFDLAISLEVAEHLSPSAAPGFVKFLTSLAPVVFFSAAIPLQGGNRHVNEQWPEYWVSKFESVGYDVLDVVRPLVWNDSAVEPWYAQNSFLFVDRQLLQTNKKFRRLRESADLRMLNLVHPEFFRRMASLEYVGGGRMVRELIRRLFRRIFRLECSPNKIN